MTCQVGQWNVTVLWSVRHLTVLLKHSLSFTLCPTEPEVTAQAHTHTRMYSCSHSNPHKSLTSGHTRFNCGSCQWRPVARLSTTKLPQSRQIQRIQQNGPQNNYLGGGFDNCFTFNAKHFLLKISNVETEGQHIWKSYIYMCNFKMVGRYTSRTEF